MQVLETLRNGGYRGQGLQKLKLSEPLDGFPREILDLGDTLEHLDLSGTGLSTLPEDFGRLQKLKIAFFSDCRFTLFPKQLAACPELEMVAFRSNGMTAIPQGALPSTLRWLILTDNRIEELPKDVGHCSRLQKCMLSGNSLTALPEEMSACHKLGLLRLSANNLADLPPWLFEMPELAFLSVAGNPCCAVSLDQELALLRKVGWDDLEVGSLLGHGASGDIFKARWTMSDSVVEEVAVKLFKGKVTSDGTPLDEMAACLAAGSHVNLISTLASIQGHPEKHGLIMQLIPLITRLLAFRLRCRHVLETDTRPEKQQSLGTVLQILRGVAAAARHLHSRNVSHCDLYAHNILFDETGHSLLGDFGAATIYEHLGGFDFEKLEVLAFGHLVEDMLGLANVAEEDGQGQKSLQELRKLHTRCSAPIVRERPTFAEAVEEMQAMTVGQGEVEP